MTQQLRKRLISIQEYHKMAAVGILSHRDKVELIQGEILHMSPIGSKHQSIVDKLSRILNRLLLDEAIVRVQGPIQIKDWSEPEPDLLLLRPKVDFYADQHPEPKDTLLLIEVANSSLEYDKTIKLPLYAEASIQTYWIINIPNQQIEVYQNPDGNIYKSMFIFKGSDDIPVGHFSDCVISVNDILG